MARRGDAIYRRGNTWWLDFVHRGDRHVVRIGSNINRTIAKEIAQVERGKILRGEAGIGKKRKDLSFDDAAKLFGAWAETNKRPRTAAFYAHCVSNLKKTFEGKTLGAITPFLVEKHKRDRSLDAGPVAANRELATLRVIFNRCLEWGKFEGENPVRKVRFLKESEGRLRYLEYDEEEKLLAAAAEPLRTLIVVSIYTGIRMASEALTLRWANVDFRRGLITVQAAYAKNGKARSIPMNSRVRTALAELQKTATTENVFVTAGKTPLVSPRTAFETACKRAGLDDVSPHVLRHTFASRLAMAGVDLRTIQELGGWRMLSMVQRYAHLSPSHKAEAVERIAKNSPAVFPTSAAEAESASA
jgi:integrase